MPRNKNISEKAQHYMKQAKQVITSPYRTAHYIKNVKDRSLLKSLQKLNNVSLGGPDEENVVNKGVKNDDDLSLYQPKLGPIVFFIYGWQECQTKDAVAGFKEHIRKTGLVPPENIIIFCDHLFVSNCLKVSIKKENLSPRAILHGEIFSIVDGQDWLRFLEQTTIISDFVKLITRLIDHNRKVYLYGNSFGGAICNCIYDQIPDQKFSGELYIRTTGSIYISGQKKQNINIKNEIHVEDQVYKYFKPTKAAEHNTELITAPVFVHDRAGERHEVKSSFGIHNTAYSIS